MSEERVIQTSGPLLSQDNVTDRFAFVARITGPLQYREETVPAGTRADGSEYDAFTKVTGYLPIEQIHPERRDDAGRELRFNLTRNEGESVTNDKAPRLNPRTALGKLADDFGNVGLAEPDSAENVGNVVVFSQWGESRNGSSFTTTRYDVIQNFGDGDFDIDEAVAVAEDEMSGKKVVSADF